MKMASRVFFTLVANCLSLYAQQYEAQFTLEKETWLAGEPVIADFELKNISKVAIKVNDSDCFHNTWFESDDAPKPSAQLINLQGCSAGIGYGGSCLEQSRLVQPGETQTRRYVVKDGFSLREPGEFHVRAHRWVQLLDPSEAYKSLAESQTTTYLTVKVKPSDRSQVLAIYESFERASRDSDHNVAGFALDALTADPPEYLESVMISLADDKRRAYSAIRGLSRIGTESSHRKLAQVVDSSEGALQQIALSSLADAADPLFCDFMLEKMTKLKDWSQSLAIMSAGASCGQKALPRLLALDIQDSGRRAAIATGLGNSGSPAAVPILIDMLVDPDPFVRASADGGLFTLTHRNSAKSTSVAADARDARSDWTSYWALHSKDQHIYKAKDCPSNKN